MCSIYFGYTFIINIFNFQLFFKEKLQDEDGYILYVRKNALQILIPKYGLECTLFLTQKGETSNIFSYDEEACIN